MTRLGDDSDLVRSFQEGDLSAFSEIFRRHQPTVTRLLARLLGTGVSTSPAAIELEDLVQDVFVQVYRNLGAFRGNARLSTWIYRIAVNALLMHRRSAAARPRFTPANETTVAVDSRPHPDEELEQRKSLLALYHHLEGLSEKKRTAFVLHELEGLSPAEIAQIVGTNVLTVRTRLFYARRDLLAACRTDPYLSNLVNESQTVDDRAPGTMRASATVPQSAGPTQLPARDRPRSVTSESSVPREKQS